MALWSSPSLDPEDLQGQPDLLGLPVHEEMMASRVTQVKMALLARLDLLDSLEPQGTLARREKRVIVARGNQVLGACQDPLALPDLHMGHLETGLPMLTWKALDTLI